jgi:uncharacterized protein YjbI with pentapeptide repeats
MSITSPFYSACPFFLLRCAILTEANFTNAKLHGADFQGAFLGGAKFDGAELEEANVTGANLYEVHFSVQDPSSLIVQVPAC